MRLTKEEMVSEALVITETLKNHLAELKIRAGHLDLDENICELKAVDIKEGLEWLKKICCKEYHELTQARKLLTPEQWARYELWGDDFNDHQEVVILRKAQVNLRKVLVSQDRPNLFKKGWVNEQLAEKNGKETHKREDNESSGEQD